MNPVSWFLVFIFRVICSFPIIFIIGLAIVSLINIFIFDNAMGIYMMLIFSFFVSLGASIASVLEEDF